MGNNAQLLLSYHKPHNPVSTATIGRWLKEVLKRVGVDIHDQKFSARSTRSASVSAAKTLKLSGKTILDTAVGRILKLLQSFMTGQSFQMTAQTTMVIVF